MMKTCILTVVCALCWSATAGAQGATPKLTYDEVLDQMIPAFAKFGETLSTIKDQKTADAAKPMLKAFAKQMLELKERADELGEPKADKKAELEKKYKAKLEEAAKKMATEMVRIATIPDDGPAIVKDLSELLAPLSKKKK